MQADLQLDARHPDLDSTRQQPMARQLRFLVTAEVMEKIGVKSRSTLLKIRRTDRTFPTPRLRTGDQLVWFEHEIDFWMEQQPLAR